MAPLSVPLSLALRVFSEDVDRYVSVERCGHFIGEMYLQGCGAFSRSRGAEAFHQAVSRASGFQQMPCRSALPGNRTLTNSGPRYGQRQPAALLASALIENPRKIYLDAKTDVVHAQQRSLAFVDSPERVRGRLPLCKLLTGKECARLRESAVELLASRDGGKECRIREIDADESRCLGLYGSCQLGWFNVQCEAEIREHDFFSLAR